MLILPIRQDVVLRLVSPRLDQSLVGGHGKRVEDERQC